MSQKKKANTKKGLKKSVNRLYNALMKEKEKHRKASSLIGKQKEDLSHYECLIRALQNDRVNSDEHIALLRIENKGILDTSANLIKRIAKD